MYLYLLGVVILLCVIHVLLNYNARARLIKKLPGPKDHFIVGNGFSVICSPVEMMEMGRKFAAMWNGIYRIWIYPIAAVLIYNPDDIETILSNIKYADKTMVYSFLKPWLRDGLLLSNGAKWQKRRKILTPTFHFNILKQFCEVIDENSYQLIDNLKKSAGAPVEILPILSEFTLHSICETAMGTKLSEDTTGMAKSYKKAICEIGEYIYQRFVRVYLYPDILFNLSSYGRAQNKCLKTLHKFTSEVIVKRKKFIEEHGIDTFDETRGVDDDYVYKKKRKTAMLDLLITAEKEGHIDHNGLQEEVDMFMFAGHDTTASALTFFFMSIANHKEYQDKIREELNEIYPDPNYTIKLDDLPKMKYMECCIKESLRMFPPVLFMSRQIHETTILSNCEIPAGTYCHISIFNLHYREDLFKNPKKYDPDRFLPENSAGRHPYAYIPFSAGPRNCIGQKFAMMEMKIAIAKVIRDFDLEPVTKMSEIQFVAGLILRHNGKIKIKFIKRS